MLRFQWNSLTLRQTSDFQMLKNIVNTVKPTVGALDTETNGLHIINCKPFVIQFGFLDIPKRQGYSFAVDLEKNPQAYEILDYWTQKAYKLKTYMGHNILFDLHMLANIGFEYRGDNLTDTTFHIRYAHDALHQEEGGPPLGLKNYAKQYIDPRAKLHEQKLKTERTHKAKQYNNILKSLFKQRGVELPDNLKGKYKSFTLAAIDELFKDCIFELSDLPKNIRDVYIEWKQQLPLYLQKKVNSLVESDMIGYNTLDRDNLIKYAHYDIIYTLEIWASLQHVIDARGQRRAIEIENKCLLPWFEVERTGFLADKEYLEESRKRVKEYIIQRRGDLKNIIRRDVAVNQNAVIKNILNEHFKLNVKSTGNEALNLIKDKIPNGEAKDFINILQELRTLEKWYSVYILRFQKDLKNNDRLYPTINQVGAVSGRITSDFQQFPKNGIKTHDGKELFHPRRIIKTNSALVYLDYSQIELRFQALYTILLKQPDFNMCRAYMPYKCHRKDGTHFNYNDRKHIKNYTDYTWYHDEDDKKWSPVDVHGATTTAATGLVPGDPEFKKARSTIGKRVNFAKNYGAELNRIRTMFPDKSYEECVKINDAYYKAFPGVKNYHKFCTNRASYHSNTPNLFGVKYFNVSGHKLKNLLIQGSAAFFLKIKIIKLYEFMKKNNLKTKLQMQIHDELSWEWDPEDPPEIFFKFKEIMEETGNLPVPVIADMEVTTSTWADKIEIETEEELLKSLNT